MTLKDLYETIDPTIFVRYFSPDVNSFGRATNTIVRIKNSDIINIAKIELGIENQKPVMYIWVDI